ncbi:hypothetical protein [Spiroplasma sp. BIUS-1]|uniref:hypothetical protein n=1 Tax=Spiroplasma sp. BIUS-1 TaxID=216964 RepID=UPI001396E5FB|nr:hypothetical protein [Spiroplasma sp. BIUS-1]QHX36356.1 hypothetical protein SBIUS_v1c01030 [Spiroplasma sp. BIUS-1]
MKKVKNIFSPSNNWKTTFFLVIFVALLTLVMAGFMGFEFTNAEGVSKKFKLLPIVNESLAYIREIFHNVPSGEKPPVYNPAYVYALISNWNLIIYMLWFIVPIGFTLNHFRLIHLVGKTRRTANATIVLISSIVLLIWVINYWIGYFQWIDIMNKNKYLESDSWGYNWRTVLQQSLLIIGVALIIAMSSYNVFVETKTKYVSISRKGETAI